MNNIQSFVFYLFNRNSTKITMNKFIIFWRSIHQANRIFKIKSISKEIRELINIYEVIQTICNNIIHYNVICIFSSIKNEESINKLFYVILSNIFLKYYMVWFDSFIIQSNNIIPKDQIKKVVRNSQVNKFSVTEINGNE